MLAETVVRIFFVLGKVGLELQMLAQTLALANQFCLAMLRVADGLRRRNDIGESVIGQEDHAVAVSHNHILRHYNPATHARPFRRVAESGYHAALLQTHGLYETLWNAQQSLENYGKDGEEA